MTSPQSDSCPPPERCIDSPSGEVLTRDRVWYTAYGSNMHAARLHYYIAGGQPPGAARTYPGCRNPRQPERTEPTMLPGGIYFALESPTWTGGMAFYDPCLPGSAAARAYLVTASQFADIAAQEMYRNPGIDLDLDEAFTTGEQRLGPGRYETLVCVGTLHGYALLTFTAPWRAGDVTWNPPSAPYLGMLASGLHEAHGWSTDKIASYLGNLPGVRGTWSLDDVAARVARACANTHLRMP